MTSQINGKLWHDLNGNRFQDTFEPGIAGGTVYLDDNRNGKFDIGERSTLTDKDGNYTFSDLEAGTYIVAQTLAPGWQQMFPNPSQPGERLFATPADGSDEIVELNAVTGTEINRFTVPTWISGGPDGLAFNGNSLFLTNGSNDLWELDPNTGDLIDTDSLSIGDNFDGLATIGDKVYLLDHIANDIIEFDPVSDTVTNVLDIDGINPGVELVAGLSGDSASNQLWATDGHDQVFQIDPATGQVVQSFFANTGNFNAGVAVIGGEIYLGSLDYPQEINVVDQNGLLQRTIDIPYEVSALGGDGIGASLPSLSQESNDTLSQAVNSGLSATNPIFSDSGIIGDNSQVDLGSDVDLIAFQLEEGQRVTIDVDAWSVGTDLDSILRLFDGQGQEVAYSFGDPAPGEHWSPDPYLEFQAFAAGTYYVGVSSYGNENYDPLVEGSGNGFDGGGNTGGYTIKIALDQGNGRETANDTIYQAIATGLSSTNPGTYKEIGVIGDNVSDSTWFNDNPPQADVDFYKVQLNQGERVQIDIDAQSFGSYLDAELRLFDSRGYDVAFSDSDPAPGETNFGFDPYIDFIAPENDTYYIGVSSNGNYYDPFSSQINGGGNSHGEYSIEVTVGQESGSPGIERLFATPMDGSNHIVELNPLTGTEINRFVAPDWVSGGSDGLAYDGNSLFFTNGFDSLWELNPDTGTVIDSDFLPGGMGSIDGLAALDGKVYLLDYQRKDIIEFDPNSDTITNILDIDVINPSIDMVGGLGAMTNPNQLLVTNDQDTIFAIDPNTGVISDTFFTGTTNLLGGVAVVNNEIYVDSYMGDQTIDVLDQNGVFQRTITLPYDISALGGDGVGVSRKDLSYESNDTIAQALQSGLTGTNPGRFTDIGIIGDNPNHPESDVDVIAFQLNQGQQVTIDIDEVFDSRLDTALRLFNSTGEEVAFSTSDLAPGESVWEPYIEFEAFHSDTYYVGISGADNVTYEPFVPNSGNGWGETGAYQVTIDIDDNRGTDESNDTIFNAIATGLSSTNPNVFTDTAIIGDNGYPYNPTMAESDVDFYKVNLEAGERVTVDIDAWQVGSQLDAQLHLFDAWGYDIAWSDNESAPGEIESGFDPYLNFTAFESGTYYIGVSSSGNWYDPFVANSGSGYSTGGYNIKIGVGDYTEIPGTHTVTLNPGETEAEVDFRNRLVVPPEITVDDVTVTEGDDGSKYANFTVRLSDAYSEVVTVDYSTSDQSAIAGEDYITTNGILTFDPGETTKTVNVEIFGDTDIETDETLVLNLSNPINGAIADSQGTVTIENNDLPTLSIENISLTEGNSDITTAEFTVNLSQAFHETVTVDYTTADNSATADSDYTAINGTLTFAPGQTSQTINVDVLGDTAFEDDETFALNLSNPNNATLDNSQGVATIVKDDFPTELNITTDEVTNSYALTSYAGNQDKNALVNFTWDGNEVGITGNGWKKLALNGTINSGTILEFDFKSTAEGEIQGIGFDTDNSLSSKQFFKLYGTQGWGINTFNNYADSAGEWKSYRIDVGNFFTGEMDYLFFANDHDVKNPTASSQFRNIQLYDPELAVTANGITDTYTLDSYAGNQDKRANVNFSEDSSEVQLEGNGWKKLGLDYTITADTILEFEFKSTAEGEIQGIGFDSDNRLSSNQFFKLYGTQSWGIKDFNNYSDTAGEWQSYQIRVGDFFTGQMNYLVLGNDHDVKNPNAASQFRNIQVYEQSATDEITGTDPSVGEVDTLTGTANVDTFILGDATGALYADNGVDDYALIMDFDASQDMIQLAGNAADYQLMATSGSLPEGTGIYQDLGTSDELIGIVQTVDSLSLESSAFSFV